MNPQRHLFTPPAADGDLTPRQQAVLDALRARRTLTDVEAGQVAHAATGRHHGGACSYCADTGKDVLGALRKRGLARKPRGGDLWTPVGGNGVSNQGELPDGF